MPWTGPTPAQERLFWRALTALAVVLLAAFGFGLAWALLALARHLQDILIPLGIAAVLSYLLHPLIGLLEKAGVHRTVAVPLLFLLAAIVLSVAAWFLGPRLWREAVALAQALPGWLGVLKDEAARFIDSGSPASLRLAPVLASIFNALRSHAEALASRLLTASFTGVGGLLHWAGLALGLLFVPFYLFHFLRGQPEIARTWRDVLPLGNTALRTEAIVILEQINGYLVSFFRGQVVVAAINGLLLALGLGLVGVEAALLIGVAAAVLTVIPYLGMGLVTLATLLTAGFQAGGGIKLALLAAGVIVLVQLAEGTLVSPRVMGEKTGLGPVTVVLSILFWSTLLGGLLGAILAVPLTATLKVLLVRYALVVPPSPDRNSPRKSVIVREN